VNVTNSSLTVTVSGTANVNISSQSIDLKIKNAVDASGNPIPLKIDVAAQSVTLNVAITSCAVVLNVNVTNSTLNVNISGSSVTLNVSITSPVDASGNLKVAVQSSVTINVNIVSQSTTLNVNISSSSVTLNVNVTNSTLNVNITGASATLNVNITAQAVVLNTNISDFKASLSPTGLLEKGTRKVVSGYVSNGSNTLYTVPSGKRAYVLTLQYYAYNSSTTGSGTCYVLALIVDLEQYLLYLPLRPSEKVSGVVTGGLMRLEANEYIRIFADSITTLYVTILIIEVPA
jgi:hypothetical protein